MSICHPVCCTYIDDREVFAIRDRKSPHRFAVWRDEWKLASSKATRDHLHANQSFWRAACPDADHRKRKQRIDTSAQVGSQEGQRVTA